MIGETIIIDHGSGNLRSAEKAFQRMAGNRPVRVSNQAEDVAKAERIVLPGVGAFADCMAGLTALPGMVEALEQRVVRDARPLLGVCVGMQMLATRGLEFGDHPGLGWVPGEVAEIEPNDPALKVPHMGWNELMLTEDHPVTTGLGAGAHVYFVHSYHMAVADPAHRIAHANHGQTLTAIVAKDTIVGTQFHPEKSQAAGLRLIENFLNWAP